MLAAAAQPAQALLPIQHWQTPSGARVYFVENHDLPMLDLSVDFPAGSGFDTPREIRRREHDATACCGSARTAWTRTRSRAASPTSARSSAGASTPIAPGSRVRTLVEREGAAQALDVFARILRRPEFPQAVLEREKVRLIGALKEADTRPDTIAARTFNRLVYRDHPYGLRSSGEVGDGGEDHARRPRGVPPQSLRRGARGRRDDGRRLARGGRGDRRSS